MSRPVKQALTHLLQFAGASVVAALAAYAIWTHLPDELDVRTDIIGYPIHSNFNVNRYFWLYGLIAGFIPVVSLVILLALRRIPRNDAQSRPRAGQPAEESPLRPASHTEVATVGIARLLFVGAIFGLEAAFALSWESAWFLAIGLPTMAGYALLTSLAAVALGRAGRLRATFWDRLALANAFAVPFCVAALYAVSRSTEVTVTSSGRVHQYSWLPLWLAAGLTGLALVWPIRAVIRARVGHELRALERLLLLVVAGPVALLLFVALLPGALGEMDMFHDGELLAGARLVGDGAFPWRDLIFIHGVLTDAAFPWVGFSLFEESRWGSVAGTLVVVLPLYWISFYYLFAYLFHRNWLFLVGTQLAVILGVVSETNLRFIGLPLVFVLLGAVLSKPSRLRAALFMTLLVAQTIVTPEAAIAAVAVLVTVVAFEAYYYDRSRALAENFRRTLSCAGAGIVLTAIWAAFLVAFGALDDFVSASLEFASDHELTGGIPVDWISDRYRFAAVAPVVLVVLAFWYFAAQILRRGPLRIADWVMGAVALFVAFYYYKFLARADHGFQSYAFAIPLVFYAAYRLIGIAEDGLARIASRLEVRPPIRYPITALAVLALLVLAPLSVSDVVADAPSRLDSTAAKEPAMRAIGFLEQEGTYDHLLGDVTSVLRDFLGPEDVLFDFSNSPALFHYILERRPATRYYHVSLAIRRDAQEDLVKELERTRPKLVVFSSIGIGLPHWDGISNQVRHYLVSRYLLDHYRPVISQEGFVFMARKDARLPPGAPRLPEPHMTDLQFRTYPCDWGYAPNFLTAKPREPSSSRPLSVTPRDLKQMLTVSGWAIDREAQVPARVVAAIDGRIVAQGAPSGPRPDVAAQLNDQAYLRSGFVLGVGPTAVPRDRMQAVRIYGLSRSGRASELNYGPGGLLASGRPAGPTELRLAERRIPVVSEAAEGAVDSTLIPSQVLALDPPPGTRHSGYDWLEIEARSPLHVNGFMLSDRPTTPERSIVFKTLARGERTVRVLVGACSQWHGYRSGRLYLSADRPEAIRAIRLYR